MPIYEYRCSDCGAISSALLRVSDYQRSLPCESCGEQAQPIISRPVVHLSRTSKLEKLDPRYDKLANDTMNSNPLSDPDRLLKKMKPLGKG